MYTVRRVSGGDGIINVMVQRFQGDGDAGLAAGGSFWFYPAGSEDGPDHYEMAEASARAIMEDPGIAIQFQCEPPLPAREADSPTPLADAGDERKRRRRGNTESETEVRT